MKKALSITALTAALIFPITSSSWASEYIGGPGSAWTTGANWNPASAPITAGSVATFSGVATLGVSVGSAISVGTISLEGSNNAAWNINITSPLLTLNQDGAGTGFATISNSNTNTGFSNQLTFGQAFSGLVLGDDLLISNTGASTVANGSISIRNSISGTGNVTFSNVANSVVDASTYAGAIRLQSSSTNSFTGAVLVEKGAVVFAASSAFGNSANTITLGKSGSGSATMLAVGGTLTVPNNIVVASGSGGTLMMGSVITGGSNATTYSGTLTLNGDVSLRSENSVAAPTLLSGVISGAGKLTKIGGGFVTISNASNTFTGATKVSAGTLSLGHVDAIKTSPLDVTGAGTVEFTAVGTNYTLGGLVNSAGTGAVGTTVAAGANSITLDPASTSRVTINSGTNFTSTAAITLTTSATFTLNGNLIVTFSNTIDPGIFTFNLFDGNNAGTFDSVSIVASYVATLDAGNGYTAVSGDRILSFDNTTGILSLTMVPEPGSVGAVIAALMGALILMRRRARS
jgi:fibronectin-binding autotransporter adhesin